MEGELSREKVLTILEKLLALQSSPNPNEAALATAKIEELLLKYNLSLGEVKVTDSSMGKFSSEWTSGVSFAWEIRLGAVLSEYFSVKIVHSHNSYKKYQAIRFLGRKVNAESAAKLYTRLHDLFRLGAMLSYQDYLKESYTWDRMDDREFRNSWLYGAVEGVRVALESQRQRATSQERSLLVVMEQETQEYFQKEYPVIKRGERRTTSMNGLAVRLGLEFGRRSFQEKLPE